VARSPERAVARKHASTRGGAALPDVEPAPGRHGASPLVQGSGGRAGATPPSVARRRERVASPSGNGEPPPPAARRPRAGAALAGASRAIAVAAAPADGEVTDGGGWKRNEWWGVVRVRWGIRS
jgi:hypothetical protein